MGGYLKRLFSTGISCIHEEALPLVSVASTRAENRESRWLHVVCY